MSGISSVLRRAFRFDLDAYFLFSDSLQNGLLSQCSNVHPKTLTVDFYIVEEPSDDELLIDLCKEGGYFGSTDQVIRKNLALTFGQADRCIVAKCESRYVAMSWVALGRNAQWPPFAQVPLTQKSSGLLHLSYVKPEYRGHCLQRFLDLQRKKLLAEQGFEQSVSFVGVNNFSSVRNSMACNESFKLMYHLSVEIPGLKKINFFPKWNQESWKSCRAHASRWMP
ncbi:hypothetical protein [Marinobacter sp. ATCH36]|uniref:hypothetical protein n=1 Tax=Marinobacter sp. ATCH36 TaxID=2945106 RepID=UPI002021B5D3|nr:hypothetical protein [Marinobacter sp. ATCH36]MCL7945681.1 hypothetical protein [Marinobacter sp. ATCH36]